MQGIVKKKMDKGFGFIAVEGQAKEVFFHGNSLVGITFAEIREGDVVTFEMADSPKGPNAINVQVVKA